MGVSQLSMEAISPTKQITLSQPASKQILSESVLANFTQKIKSCFPTYVGAVVADRHGFLVHSELPNHLDKDLVALSTIAPGRTIVDLSKFHKIIKPLSRNVRLMVLLEKSRDNYKHYYEFEKTVMENPL
jgi:hypothetical protein